MSLLTKDERYRNARMAKKARGLYRSEQQALHFIAEAQTMEKGVCSQSLKKHAADFGYTVKSLQRGIHGKRRNGKLEYPGLLARGIVYVAGGYPKGGLAPGGEGLTPDYAINLKVLLTFIPEIDDEKGDTRGDTKGDTFQKGATHRATPERTSSPSSSLSTTLCGESADGVAKIATSPSTNETPIFPVTDSDHSIPSTVSSMPASQTEPPSAVTCQQDVPAASAADEKRLGLQLQAAVSRTAKTKLGNHRRIPKNLTGKFELLVTAHGVAVVSRDFGEWCDEDPAARRKMDFPITEYIKVVDSRFCGSPAEDPRIVGWVEEISALSYDLTKVLTTTKQKKQILEVLKVCPVARIKDALTYYINHLPEEPTSSSLRSFWTVSNIDAVLRADRKMREATEGDEDLRKVKPIQRDLQALKRQVGMLPFKQRLPLNPQGYSSCPFHKGESDTSFHVERQDDGVGIGTCFSACGKSFDAISFVEKFDKVSTGESISKLYSLVGDIENGSASAGLPPKRKSLPMTTERWMQSGQAVTDAVVAKLADSRPNSRTPSPATLNTMGFKIGLWGHLIAPYRLGNVFYTIKGRDLATKKFLQENAISQHGLFNIDAVTEGCDVSVVESELDAAVLYESGYTAVSVMNATQRKIEPEVMTKLLTAGRIFLVGDTDEAGKTCMNHFAGLLPSKKVFRVTPPDGVKDVGEWATSAHFQEQFESAIRTASQSEIPVGSKS